jgi:hypothetical protein
MAVTLVGRDANLGRIRAAATDLIRRRYMLEEDLDRVVEGAGRHWDFATRPKSASASDAR